MSSKFCIVSDGSCDIPEALAKENDIDIVHFLVSFNSSDYKKEGVDQMCIRDRAPQRWPAHPEEHGNSTARKFLSPRLKGR